ncbi:MAG: hypothetical protein AVDCRST_MAG35-2529, partial [uncultured Quadrisphaera sp.]
PPASARPRPCARRWPATAPGSSGRVARRPASSRPPRAGD